MRAFAISRTCGSGGGALARSLALRRGWPLYDRAGINTWIEQQYHVRWACGSDGEAPCAIERFRELMDNRSFYRVALEASVFEIVLRGDVVFLGGGVHRVLAGYAGLAAVRVVRRQADRVRAVAALKGIDIEAALDHVTHHDKERAEFESYYFDADSASPESFGIVLNSDRVTADSAVDLAARFGDGIFESLDIDGARSHLTARLIERKAEMLLHSLGLAGAGKLTFTAGGDGHLSVRGVVGGDDDRKRLVAALGGIDGVTGVTDEVKVGILSALIY